MKRLLIVMLVAVSVSLPILLIKMCREQFQAAMESVCLRMIQADNDKKMEQWLEEKRRYESSEANGSGN